MDEQTDATPENEPRVHPQDPSEGADDEGTPSGGVPRVHPEDPAEGPDDESAESGG